MKLKPDETKLCGTWRMVNGQAQCDATCERIEKLVSSALILVGTAEGGWSKLYRDPSDGRLWEFTYPYSERHGGGPPCLKCMSREEAAGKYGDLGG